MKNVKSILSILLLAIVGVGYSSNIKFESLKCDMQSEPMTIESATPTLSWVVNAEGYNRSQSGYQILVSSSLDNLSERKADMWNSHKVSSSQMAFVKYAGKELKPQTKYFWSVKVWTEDGKPSEWSAPSTFETGLMGNTEWVGAEWISLGKDDRESPHRYREYVLTKDQVTSHATAYMRNVVRVDKSVKSARAYICGLGYYELYINGDKVGDHLLDPAPSNYDKQAYYVNFDVTSMFQSGENSLAIILGNGFYGQNISWKRDPESLNDVSYGVPAVKMFVDVKYSDGSCEKFTTNGDWKSSTGAIVFDNIYGGETYDARYEKKGWDLASYDDSKWANVVTQQPKIEKVSAQNIPPIRNLKEFSPERIFTSPDGDWIVDFGYNMAGWVRLEIDEAKGQMIEIITTEALTKDGKDVYPGSTGGGANGMAQILQYVSNGEGCQTWEPRFTYHGFRYAKIKGTKIKPTRESIKAVVVATDMDQNGMFRCSEPLYNKMDEISRWTIVNNMHGIPEDCPHREKCGWLGDAHAFCEYALYNYDLLNFYKKFMIDIRTQCKPTPANDGSGKKYMMPSMIAPGKRRSTQALIDWGVATIYLPWYNYVQYGDTDMVTEFYPDMKDMVEYYLTFKDANGIMDNGMGDWCPPLWDRKLNPEAMECHPVISANAYFYDVLGIMVRFAKINGDDEYAQKMEREQNELRDAFNKQYLKKIPMVNTLWYGSQTATVMALQFGMVPQDKINSVVRGLVYDIVGRKGTHHAVGIHGMRYIYTVLSRYGKGGLAHDILTTPTFPSQTYLMNYGFTTWPERQFLWDEMAGLSNSLNHPMHSGFAAYFYESLGGVKSSYDKVGYKEFTVSPQLSSGVNSASVIVPTIYGDIHNDWVISSRGEFSMSLIVPFNTTAKVYVPSSALSTLNINGEKWDNTSSANYSDGKLTLGSGSYKIIYDKSYE